MDKPAMNDVNKGIWDANANQWDEYMGEYGNDWHRQLIAPETERLLNLKTSDNLLDIGCGNGLFSRRMAKKGVKVTAFDFSELNIQNAKKYNSSHIDYKTLDATKEDDLRQLHHQKYKGIVANMVFMDMPDVTLVFSHINTLLSNSGVFVFSIQHPCFNSEYASFNDNGSLQLTDYLKKDISKGMAIASQPEKQYYFHRPINYYSSLGFSNGLVMNGFVESAFNNPDSDNRYSKFPAVLIISMVKK